MTLKFAQSSGRPRNSEKRKEHIQFLLATVVNLIILAAATVTLVPLVGSPNVLPVLLVYLLPVAFAAWFWSFEQSIITSLASALAVAYFFFKPFFSFRVADPKDVVALLIFLIAALLVGYFLGEIRERRRKSHLPSGSALNFTNFSRTVPERIAEFLVNSDGMYCDQCIQKNLGLKWRQQVQLVTATLAVMTPFERSITQCCSCSETKQAIGISVPVESFF
jgi:K+-sensing histidine kinase KdpD